MQVFSAHNSNLSVRCIRPASSYCVRNRAVNKSMNNTMSISNTRNDVIIVGAGVAGSALAYGLAKDGRRVLIIDRSLKEPNKVSGEMLQPAGYQKLVELGLEDCVRGIDAQVLHGYIFSFGDKSVTFPFPLEEYGGSEAGARAFHHGRFVQKLRHKATSLSNVKLEQGTVTNFIEERGVIKGVRYKSETEKEISVYAPLTVVSDGCFSNFRKFLSKPKINTPSHIVCVTIENLQALEWKHAHLVMGNPLGAYIYPISSTELRCGIDLPGIKLPSICNGQMAQFLKSKVTPQVPHEILRSFITSVDKGNIRTMPVSCMPAAPRLVPGALLLGDALNMRHALLSGGMTIALNDITLILNIFRNKNLEDTYTTIKCAEHFYLSRKPLAFTMNLLADGMHKVVYTCPDELREEIWTALFNYCDLGEDFIKGPIKLISGLSSDPWTLFLNLMASATFVSCSMMFSMVATPKHASVVYQWAVDALSFIVLRLWEEDLGRVLFTTPNFERMKLK